MCVCIAAEFSIVVFAGVAGKIKLVSGGADKPTVDT